jgi:hypothetical protein
MDNASTDGTRDKLVELSRTYAIEIIDQPAIDFQKKTNGRCELSSECGL